MLATKLHVPPLRPSLVRRTRLIERMNEGQDNKLTLIAAPAGFGKTTLLSEWASGIDQPIAWLSLDATDNNPAQFVAYLIAALQTIAPQLGEGALAALQSPQPPPTEAVLTALLNEITALEIPFVLVLDDYHLIDATAVDLALTFMLDHLPPQMHLSIVLAWTAIMRRDIAQHGAWMIRGYALGQGAGTQVLVMLPWTLIYGEASGLTRDLLMSAAWVINLAVDEWIIRRRPATGRELISRA